MARHKNIYLAPFNDFVLEKTASAESGISKVARSMVSGDTEEFDSQLSDEDRAFFALSDDTRVKLASGIPLDSDDVNRMPETEIAALTLLGEDAMFKTAAYMEFYNEAAMAEQQGRNLARAAIGQEKLAQASLLVEGEKLASDPRFMRKLGARAAAELKRRQGQ